MNAVTSALVDLTATSAMLSTQWPSFHGTSPPGFEISSDTSLADELRQSGVGILNNTIPTQDNVAATSCPESTIIKELVVPTIYIIICAVGLIGNGLVLVLLIRQDQNSVPGNRSVTNLLVINLAIADFIFVGALPFWAAELFQGGYWSFGTVGCKLLSFISLLNLYGSVFFLVAMGIDRYLAIVFAVRVRNYRTPRNAIRVCAGIWLFASLIASQGLAFRKLGTQQCSGKTICKWDLPSEKGWVDAYFVVRTALGFFLPFFVIMYCYVFIIVSLKRRSRNLNASGVRITTNQHKVTRLILCVISMFVVCWLPNHIITLMNALTVRDSDASKRLNLKTASLFSSCLAYANSSINPILYAFMKDDVRMRLISLVRKCLGLTDLEEKRRTPVHTVRMPMENTDYRANDNATKKSNDEHTLSTPTTPRREDGNGNVAIATNCAPNFLSAGRCQAGSSESSESLRLGGNVETDQVQSAKSVVVMYNASKQNENVALL